MCVYVFVCVCMCVHVCAFLSVYMRCDQRYLLTEPMGSKSAESFTSGGWVKL